MFSTKHSPMFILSDTEIARMEFNWQLSLRCIQSITVPLIFSTSFFKYAFTYLADFSAAAKIGNINLRLLLHDISKVRSSKFARKEQCWGQVELIKFSSKQSTRNIEMYTTYKYWSSTHFFCKKT